MLLNRVEVRVDLNRVRQQDSNQGREVGKRKRKERSEKDDDNIQRFYTF